MMDYNKILEDVFFELKHVGVLDCSYPLTVCGRKGNNRSAFFDLYLSCNQDGVIRGACYKVYGNPYLIVSLEWICRQMENKDLKQALSLDHKQLITQLEIPARYYPLAILAVDGACQLVEQLKQLFEEKPE